MKEFITLIKALEDNEKYDEYDILSQFKDEYHLYFEEIDDLNMHTALTLRKYFEEYLYKLKKECDTTLAELNDINTHNNVVIEDAVTECIWEVDNYLNQIAKWIVDLGKEIQKRKSEMGDINFIVTYTNGEYVHCNKCQKKISILGDIFNCGCCGDKFCEICFGTDVYCKLCMVLEEEYYNEFKEKRI